MESISDRVRCKDSNRLVCTGWCCLKGAEVETKGGRNPSDVDRSMHTYVHPRDGSEQGQDAQSSCVSTHKTLVGMSSKRAGTGKYLQSLNVTATEVGLV